MGKMILCALALMLSSSAFAQACYNEVDLQCGPGLIDRCDLIFADAENDQHECVKPKFDQRLDKVTCITKDGKMEMVLSDLQLKPQKNGQAEAKALLQVTTRLSTKNGPKVVRQSLIVSGQEANSNKGIWYEFSDTKGSSIFLAAFGPSGLTPKGQPTRDIDCNYP